MALPGITVERDLKGRTSKVIINAKSKSEFVEDLLDLIALQEALAEDDGVRYKWEDVKAELEKKHKWKKNELLRKP